MSIKNWNTETICIQGGYTPKSGEPRILPIIQSTTYKYDDPDKVANLFDLKEEGHMYTRISNPTVAAFEEKNSTVRRWSRGCSSFLWAKCYHISSFKYL